MASASDKAGVVFVVLTHDNGFVNACGSEAEAQRLAEQMPTPLVIERVEVEYGTGDDA